MRGLTVLMLPESIGRLNKLVRLTLSFNKNLETLPNTICDLRALESLYIGGCSSVEALPLGLGNIKSLQVLDAEGLAVFRLPDSMGQLPSSLKWIRAAGCASMESLPNVSNLKLLEKLDLTDCSALTEIQGLEEVSLLYKYSVWDVQPISNGIHFQETFLSVEVYCYGPKSFVSQLQGHRMRLP
ncbi:hypothetical protein ACET3Z_006538 [Daucus carota]